MRFVWRMSAVVEVWPEQPDENLVNDERVLQNRELFYPETARHGWHNMTEAEIGCKPLGGQ